MAFPTVAPPMDSPTVDIVGTYLASVSLLDRTREFRGALATIGADPKQVTPRELVIATTAVLMNLGGVEPPAVTLTINALMKLSNDELQSESAVGIMNGQYLALPLTGGGIRFVNFSDWAECAPPKSPMISTIYNIGPMWEAAASVC